MLGKRSLLILLSILSIIIIIVTFVVFTHLGLQSDLVAVPGVKGGDYFTYDIKSFWISPDPDVTPEEDFLEINQTEWFKVSVIEVSGAEVSINTIWRFNNGTELERTGTMNVEAGIYYPTDGFWAIYATNLKAGDYVRPFGLDRSTVNKTSSTQYAGGSRETNRISLVQEAYDANDPTYTRTWIEYRTVYFDRQTGMLVELRDINVTTNPDLTETIVWTIVDTNVWAIS
jgi:hypothetical protein